MSYIILYVIVSLLICFTLSLIVIKAFFLVWNNVKSRSINLSFTTKNMFMVFIPVTVVLWIGLTIFILANLKMH